MNGYSRHTSESSDQPEQIAKRGLTNNKVLMCCYWPVYGIEHLEFLSCGQTITSDVYCDQLDKVEAHIKQTWPSHVYRAGVFFHQDNVRPHTAMNTRRKIEELKWITIEHGPYSPDKAPSDFYLFRKLQSYLVGADFRTRAETIEAVKEYFETRPKGFYKEGIYKLPQRWKAIIESKGEYLDN